MQSISPFSVSVHLDVLLHTDCQPKEGGGSKELTEEDKSRTWEVIPFTFMWEWGAVPAVRSGSAILNRAVLFLGGMVHHWQQQQQ